MVVMTSAPSFLRMRVTNTSMVFEIAVEILVVDMLDELGPADHLALVVHQVGQELIFLRGELHRLAGLGDLARAGVEADVARDRARSTHCPKSGG